VKDLVILGGPNGAGKTTAAKDLLRPNLRIAEFLNADDIASMLVPSDPDAAAFAAGRTTLRRVQQAMAQGKSFAVETTCAGRWQLRLLRRCRAAGYRATLVFLWLPSPKHALARVAKRVASGGHNIPDDVVIRRYWAGLANMRRRYLRLVDIAVIYDNSDEGRVLIAEKRPRTGLVVRDATRWKLIKEAAP
jgi:predicted ABC-type ATPase